MEYFIQIKVGTPSSATRPQMWRDFTVDNVVWSSQDPSEVEEQVLALLQENPIPVLRVVQEVGLNISASLS